MVASFEIYTPERQGVYCTRAMLILARLRVTCRAFVRAAKHPHFESWRHIHAPDVASGHSCYTKYHLVLFCTHTYPTGTIGCISVLASHVSQTQVVVIRHGSISPSICRLGVFTPVVASMAAGSRLAPVECTYLIHKVAACYGRGGRMFMVIMVLADWAAVWVHRDPDFPCGCLTRAALFCTICNNILFRPSTALRIKCKPNPMSYLMARMYIG